MIAFHQGGHADLQGYCHGLAWDDPGLLGAMPGVVAMFNVPLAVQTFLYTVTGNGDFPALAGIDNDPDSATVLVVKGFHQAGPLSYRPHLTVDYGGRLYHVNARLQAAAMTFVDVTPGTWQRNEDVDGFRRR